MSSALGSTPDTLDAENRRLRERIVELENELACRDETKSFDFQASIDAMPIAIAILNHECRYVAVNRTLAAFHGIPSDQHVGRTVGEIVPFLADLVHEAVATVVRTGKTIVDQELTTGTVATPDNVGDWSLTWFPLQMPGVTGPMVGVVINDVSKCRGIERALRETQSALSRQVAEFDALFRALPVGVGVARDPECRVIRGNPALANLLGMSDSENVSKSRPEKTPFRVVQDGREIPADELPMQVAARTGREVRNFMYDLVREDGTTLTEYGHATPLLDDAGAVTGSIGVFLDFTELRRAQRELEVANEELRRSNADLNHFAYAASHDLREPLRAIRLSAQLLSRNSSLQLSSDAQECLTLITESSGRMDQLLLDMMNYVHVATDRRAKIAMVDLNAVLEDARMNLQIAIEESKADISADCLPAVAGQPSDYLQLFQNLIGNAIKYRGQASPVIRIDVTQDEGYWRIGVSDNGVGIDPAYASRVFDLFQRLHGREIPGSGVGLSICQRIVHRYGGRIWVESAEGEGSRFYFTVPMANTSRN